MIRWRIVVGLAIAVLATLGPAIPAQAAGWEPPESTTAVSERPVPTDAAQLALTGCGTKCDFQNPHTYYIYYCGPACEDNLKCEDDAITINRPVGTVPAFRYSPTCKTGWTRASGCYDSQGNLIATIRFYSLNTADFNNQRAVTTGPASSGVCYTRMLSIGSIWGVGSYSSGPGTSYTPTLYGY